MTGPATAANSANVQITGDVSGLLAALDVGAVKVQSSTQKIVLSFEAASKNVAHSSEQMAVAGEGLAHKFEHVGIAIAFAMTALANDSERGLTRAAHAVALLGFAFGPVAGAASTAAAIIVEQFVSSAHKAEEQAKATKERVEEMYRAIGESGSGERAAKRAQQLFSGDQFAPDSDPFAALIRAGGMQGLQKQIEAARPIFDAQAAEQRKTIELNRKIGAITEESYNQAIAAVDRYTEDHLKPLNDQLNQLRASHEEVLTLAEDFLSKQADRDFEGGKDAEKKKIQAYYRNQLAVLVAAATEQRRAFEQWQKDHPTDTSFFVDRQSKEKAEAQRKADEDMFYRGLDAEIEVTKRTNEEIKRQQEQAASAWSAYFTSTFGNAFTKFIETGENIRDVWRDLWYNIVQTTARSYIEMEAAAAGHALAIRGITLKSALETIAIKTWEALKWIAIEATKAAAAAYAAIAGIPFVGPALAVGASVAAFAGVMSLASHLGGGGGGSSSSAATASRGPVGGGGGGNTYVIQAMDAKSFKEFSSRNPDAFVHVIAQTVKSGALTPKKLGLG